MCDQENNLFKSLICAARKILSAFILSVLASQCFSQSSIKDDRVSNFQYLKRFNAVFDFVQQNYVDEIDPEVLYEGAMKGLLNSFDDPYTSYLDSDTIRDLSDTTTGNFGGVGLTITKPAESTAAKPAYVEVSSPVEDSPGSKAGIISGDFIIEINGKPTPEMTMEQVLENLRGEIGTPVTVKILRGKTMTFEVTLVRALIEVPTVKFGMIEKTGYLRIIQFTPDTPERVQEALDSFKKNNYKNMIIDLRDNPGGLLASVAQVSDKFIDEGPIVTTKSRLANENSTFTASKNKTVVRDVPIVVLINRGSASASEVLSGALKDNHLAYLVGQKTYGKGSVQQVIPLGEKEEIKITVARYYTPSDTNIDKIGIPPDLEVLYPELSEDEQKAFAKLMEDNIVETYVDEHAKMTEAQIASYAKELKKTYNLEEKLLRRIIRVKVWRTEPNHLYDLDYDVQLNAALDVLNKNADFKKLVASTKTLKELQLEAEKQNAEENSVAKTK